MTMMMKASIATLFVVIVAAPMAAAMEKEVNGDASPRTQQLKVLPPLRAPLQVQVQVLQVLQVQARVPQALQALQEEEEVQVQPQKYAYAQRRQKVRTRKRTRGPNDEAFAAARALTLALARDEGNDEVKQQSLNVQPRNTWTVAGLSVLAVFVIAAIALIFISLEKQAKACRNKAPVLNTSVAYAKQN